MRERHDHEHDKHDAAGALEALNSIRDTREQALGKMDYWPWWYDAGYAAACALLVAGVGMPTPISVMTPIIALGVLMLIMHKWQAKTGVWVNGYAPKRARWAAFGLAGLLIGLMGLNLWLGRGLGIEWVPYATGAVAAVLGIIGMRVWMHLYRKDARDLK